MCMHNEPGSFFPPNQSGLKKKSSHLCIDVTVQLLGPKDCFVFFYDSENGVRG